MSRISYSFYHFYQKGGLFHGQKRETGERFSGQADC